MKALDDTGRLLDAEFDLEAHETGAVIVFHARYGTRGSGSEMNIDYLPALELVLARLCALRSVITTIEVDSRVARQLPLEQRVLPLPYPIRLTHGTNVGRLRRDVTEAQRKVARVSTARPSGGNNHKRIRISLTFPPGTTPTTARDSLSGNVTEPRIDQAGTRVAKVHSFDPYRDAVSDPSVSPAIIFVSNVELQERALAGHARTQNALATVIREHGFTPVSPGRSGPDFDLGWEGTPFTVVEIKSLNGANTERQLRIGLGQVLQYRVLLSSSLGQARAVLAVEHAVSQVWVDVCSSVGVVLTWPPDWPRLEVALGLPATDHVSRQQK